MNLFSLTEAKLISNFTISLAMERKDVSMFMSKFSSSISCTTWRGDMNAPLKSIYPPSFLALSMLHLGAPKCSKR